MKKEKEHPYDKVFSQKVVKKIKKTNVFMIRLNFNDFKAIEFEPYFPSFILDMVDYLTGYNIYEFAEVAREQ